jgi:hypothetical protein
MEMAPNVKQMKYKTLLALVQDEKYYPVPPHIDADNRFLGDKVMDWLGRKGYGATMTNRQDCFPKELKPYLHHDKVVDGCTKAKSMHFAMPIVAIKQQPAVEESKAYTMTLVSFQSTGATNICGVKSFLSVTNYVSKKVRGKGKTKCVWGIEQNEVRETYLHHYYGINNLDHMMKIQAAGILHGNIGMHHIFIQNQWESLQHMTCTMSAAMVFLMCCGQFQKRSGWDSQSSESNCQSKC